MSDLMIAVHLVLTIATLGILIALFVIWHAVRKNLPQEQFERLIASIEETKLSIYDLSQSVQKMQQLHREEWDNLHERLERLEQWQRDTDVELERIRREREP